jgi:large subunit GTPase 1
LFKYYYQSYLICKIVDGRNPLFFRCPDLEKYVKEVDPHKYNILLVNKSDLLSEEIRKVWSEHFTKNGLNHIFFSAKTEQEKIDTDKLEEDEVKPMEEPRVLTENTPEVFTRKNLLTVLKNITLKIKQEKWAKEPPQEDQVSKKTIPNADVITIGMVGYPNVGKSSIINVLCKKKLVGVAAMPGKTKHFQTIFIEKDLMLCDCPGLVFPNFTSTRAEMVIIF